ncbi:MAG: hypothetical protein WBN85_00825 [Candidatus Macondimonas sp.]
MKSKSLMMLALLAAAPVASQAAMVEMDDAALSSVEGQGFSFGFALNPVLGFSFDNTATAISMGGAAGVVPTGSASHVVDGDPTRNWSFGFSAPLTKSFSYTRNK